MAKRYRERLESDLTALHDALEAAASSPSSLPSLAPSATSVLAIPPPAHVITPLSIDMAGQSLTIYVPAEGRRVVKRQLNELARREKRWAADAGNAANTSQLVGGGIGGTLATGGLIALATASGPFGLIAVIATAVGSLMALVGLSAGHWLNQKKFSHEERMEYYRELIEDVK